MDAPSKGSKYLNENLDSILRTVAFNSATDTTENIVMKQIDRLMSDKITRQRIIDS
jgi:hypothetical protein